LTASGQVNEAEIDTVDGFEERIGRDPCDMSQEDLRVALSRS
jgi:hypothetical protein